MSKWVILCPSCDEEFRIEEEDVPEACPKCKFTGEFEIVDEDDGGLD